MASTLTHTFSTPTLGTKSTISMWIKRSDIGSDGSIFSTYTDTNNRADIRFNSVDKFSFYENIGGSQQYYVATNRLFRDPSAFYHLVCQFDTTQSTAADRIKLWVNGSQETSFSSTSFPTQNQVLRLGSALAHTIGDNSNNTDQFEGYISHIAYVDGSVVAPTVFGETDSTSGIWKFKSPSGVTWGTNGFHLKFENSGNLGLDSSGQSNNFTTNGNLKQGQDTPSNVFATLNPLVRVPGNLTYSCGNTKIARSGSAEWRTSYSTLAMSTGKYYFEALSDAGNNNVIGIRELQNADGSTAGSGNDYPGYTSQGWSLYNLNGTVYNGNVTSGSAIGTFTNGDYIGVFLDCDNQKLYFSKNGTMLNTTGYSISAVPYVFGVALYDDGGGFSCNFGNGTFGTTQLTGTTYNGSDGNGIFKYNPNNITLDGSSKSFKSLSTKGLNS